MDITQIQRETSVFTLQIPSNWLTDELVWFRVSAVAPPLACSVTELLTGNL